MLRLTTLFLIGGLLCVMCLPAMAFDWRDLKNREASVEPEAELITPEKPVLSGKGGQVFSGHLRVYVVEPTSRWKDQTSRTFNYAFLDIAANQGLTIPYLNTYTLNTSWDGDTIVYYYDGETPVADSNFGDITEDNIMVIAAVFDSVPHETESAAGYPFTAYYCVASAAATPGNPGANLVNENYTHTVFVEEGATHT